MILCNIYSYGFSVLVYVGLPYNILSNPIFVFNAVIISLPACGPILKFFFYPHFPIFVYVNSICII